MNILITAVGGPSGICFAKSLSEIKDVRLIGTSAEEDTIGKPLVHAFHIVPFATDPAYLDTLKRIIKDEHVNFIIPTVDEEMRLLSEHSEHLGCKVLVSPFETVLYTSDKGKMYEIAAEYLPARYTKSAAPSFTVFAKPKIGRGGKGAFVVKTADELSRVPDEGYVIQELLETPEVSVDAMFDFEGNLVVAVPRVRSTIDQGISVTGTVFHDDSLLRIIRAITSRLRFVGPVNFQFMRGAEEYKLTEINARGSGGMGITIHSGADIPKLSYELMATGTIVSIPEVREGEYANFDEVLERQRIKKESQQSA